MTAGDVAFWSWAARLGMEEGTGYKQLEQLRGLDILCWQPARGASRRPWSVGHQTVCDGRGWTNPDLTGYVDVDILHARL